MSRAQRLTIGHMQVACSTQRRTFSFQRFIHARQPRSDHRLVQRRADQTWQPQPQLPFTPGFLPTLVLGTLVHGGFLLLPNPIFRSGEDCRHSILNSLQDIADIPASHPSGTFWYHTHKHGSVTFNLLGGTAGFLIVKGGRGTLDAVPEVAAARDVVMAFQEIRTDLNGNTVFVNQQATQFGTFPFGTEDPTLQGVWSLYGLDGAPGLSNFYFTTNGVTNPTLHMQPGEVQRWRLLNATEGENLLLT